MIHEKIPIQMSGSSKETHLTTYILDAYEEQPEDLVRPFILICPGGAYRFTADREAEMIALQFSSMGYHAAVLRYSCAPCVFPTALTEVARSVQMIHEQAKAWRVDTDNIFVMGFFWWRTSGSQLWCLLGTGIFLRNCQCNKEILKVKGLILCYPVITSREDYGHLESIHTTIWAVNTRKRKQ